MKTLCLVRHGEAAIKPGIADFDRPLTSWGRQQVKNSGKEFTKLNLSFDLLVTSSALRAVETGSMLTEAMNYQGVVETRSTLYDASQSAFLAELLTFSNDYASILVVAHNPGIFEVAMKLLFAECIGFGCGDGLVLEFPVEDWRDLLSVDGSVVQFINGG